MHVSSRISVFIYLSLQYLKKVALLATIASLLCGKDVKDLLTIMALCNLIYVKEYKCHMSKLFCWLYFVDCTIIIRNYYAYLILTFLVMTDIVKQLLML